MPYTDKDKAQLVEELFDPNKVSVYCGLHNYFGPGKEGKFAPHMDCPKCWLVYYIYDIANTPASQRRERMEELEQVVHHMVETAQKGQLDFNPLEHPQVVISSEDDEDSVPENTITLASN